MQQDLALLRKDQPDFPTGNREVGTSTNHVHEPVQLLASCAPVDLRKFSPLLIAERRLRRHGGFDRVRSIQAVLPAKSPATDGGSVFSVGRPGVVSVPCRIDFLMPVLPLGPGSERAFRPGRR